MIVNLDDGNSLDYGQASGAGAADPILRGLVAQLSGDLQRPTLRLCQGIVDDVAVDNSATVRFSGSAIGIAGIKCLSIPAIDDSVWALVNGPDRLVIGTQQTEQSLGPADYAKLLATVTGPAVTTDCFAAGAALLTVTVNVISQKKYKITAYVHGSTINGDTGTTYFGLTDDQGGLKYPAYSNVTPIGYAVLGTAVHVMTASSTRVATFSISGYAQANAMRVAIDACQLTVEAY